MSNRRGFTYPEVLVATVILSLLTGIGILLFQFAKRTEQKAETDNDAFRQGSMACARLRRELRGAEIISPEEGVESEFLYRYPRLVDGNLAVSDLGKVEWEGEARIFVQDGNLMLEKPVGGEVSLLAQLSEGRFQIAVDPAFYAFQIEVKRPGEDKPAFERVFRRARVQP